MVLIATQFGGAASLISDLTSLIGLGTVSVGAVNGALGLGLAGLGTAFATACGPCFWSIFTLVGVGLGLVSIVSLYFAGVALPEALPAIIGGILLASAATGVYHADGCNGLTNCPCDKPSS